MPARPREPLARDLPAELQVAATNGSTVTDSGGRKYIDAEAVDLALQAAMIHTGRRA